MNDALKTLLEISRKVRMPIEEREAQRRSFAYGNTHFENPLITREMVNQAAEKVDQGAFKVEDIYNVREESID
jgi:hypothetical protein